MLIESLYKYGWESHHSSSLLLDIIQQKNNSENLENSNFSQTWKINIIQKRQGIWELLKKKKVRFLLGGNEAMKCRDKGPNRSRAQKIIAKL